jgi:hypothetical protein
MVIAGGNGDVVVPYEAAAELLFSRPEDGELRRSLRKPPQICREIPGFL